MKKGLLFILLAAVSVCLPAQEKEKAATSYSVETNRFGANWFISGGLGAQMYFGDNDGKLDFGKLTCSCIGHCCRKVVYSRESVCVLLIMVFRLRELLCLKIELT